MTSNTNKLHIFFVVVEDTHKTTGRGTVVLSVLFSPGI